MKKKVVSLILAAAMAVSLVACGGSGNGSKEGDTKTESAEQKISTVMFSDPDTLDPGRADDEQKNQIVLESQETLLRLIDGKLTEAGAESYEVSEDGLVYTFHLRDNKYADGEEVKAQDYVNSIRRIFDPEVNCHNAGIFYCITGGEAFNTGAGSKEDV